MGETQTNKPLSCDDCGVRGACRLRSRLLRKAGGGGGGSRNFESGGVTLQSFQPHWQEIHSYIDLETKKTYIRLEAQALAIILCGVVWNLIYRGLFLTMRPPLNKKLFPVHRPGGLKRADWDFFS